MPTCPNCGSENPENMAFCMHCGTAIEEVSVAQESQEGAESESAAPTDVPVEDIDRPEESVDSDPDEDPDDSVESEGTESEEGPGEDREDSLTDPKEAEFSPKEDQQEIETTPHSRDESAESDLDTGEGPPEEGVEEPEAVAAAEPSPGGDAVETESNRVESDEHSDAPGDACLDEEEESLPSMESDESDDGHALRDASDSVDGAQGLEIDADSPDSEAMDSSIGEDMGAEDDEPSVPDTGSDIGGQDPSQAGTVSVTEPEELVGPLSGLPEPHSSPVSPLQFEDGGQGERGVRWWLSPEEEEPDEPDQPTEPHADSQTRIPSRAAVEINRRDSDVHSEAQYAERSNLPVIAAIVVIVLVITAFMVL